MTSVYELASISNLPEMAYQYFMNYENEVLYFLNEGKLLGVLSIGDLERFYGRNEDELKINQNYTLIDIVDYDVAARFFDSSATINEIPVVTVQGDLLGIIRREKTQICRKHQRRMLKSAKAGECNWRKKEIRRFVNETEASVFLYTYSVSKVMEQLDKEDKQKIEKREYNIDEFNSIWNVLSDQEWKVLNRGLCSEDFCYD